MTSGSCSPWSTRPGQLSRQGSADGYSSVLIRTEEGLEAWSYVRERLETRPLDRPQALNKLDDMGKRVAFKSLKRAFDPDAPLFIDYEEHLSNYVGTDRAPVEHEAVRYWLEDARRILPLPEEPADLGHNPVDVVIAEISDWLEAPAWTFDHHFDIIGVNVWR
jgi:hypothetical protein